MKYTILSVLGMASISCYILADTYFVAQKLGTNGLAALNIAIPIYNFIHGTGLMLGMGGATRFSICKSRKENGEANVMYINTLYLSALFSAVFFMIGVFLSEPLTMLLRADDNIFEMSNIYLKMLFLFAPAFILNDVFLCFVRNDENPKLSMLATTAGSLSNIFLDYVFMFHLGMGILGAVLATGLAPVIGIIIMLPHLLKKTKGFHYVKTRLQKEQIKWNLSLGFPSLLAQVSSGLVIIIFNVIILNLTGNTGVAAYGVIANISLVTAAVYTGIAQGIQPLVSREYGKNNIRGGQKFLYYSLFTMIVLSCIIYSIVSISANSVVQIFNSENNREMQEIAVYGLKIYFTSIIFTGYNIIISMYFTSVEKAVQSHIISLLRGFVLIIPMAFFASAFWSMTGVWLALPITELVVTVLGIFFLQREKENIWTVKIN